MDPLVIASGARPPLNLRVNIPVILERDAVKVDNASFNSAQSRIDLSASIEKLKAPVLAARMTARLSLPEIQRSINLPIDANRRGAPTDLTAQLAVNMNATTGAIEIRQADLALGKTTFEAHGNLDPVTHSSAAFQRRFCVNGIG